MCDDRVVSRILFRRLESGDLLKFEAHSSSAGTGGGARDLRFGPRDIASPLFARFFPETTEGGGKEIRTGTVYWKDGDAIRHKPMEIWPPTDSRPTEIRITKIHSFGFQPLIERARNGEGFLLFLLYQEKGGRVFVHFSTETSLAGCAWHSLIREFFQRWVATEHGKNWGGLDFEHGERYPANV